MSGSTLIRLEKLHTLDRVSGAGAHNSRSNPPSHANFLALSRNVVLKGEGPAPRLLISRFRKLNIRIPLKPKGLHRKTKEPLRQRIIAWNVLCAVGGDFFKKVEAEVWAIRTLTYLEKTFGSDNVLRAELHWDERVPHFHAIVAPVTASGRLSARQIYFQDQATEPEDMNGVRRGNGSTPFLRRLQREYHELCRGFDPSLTEPVPGGVITHRLVEEWREWVARAYQEMPQVPAVTVEPPSPQDFLSPEDYARRQVNTYRDAVAEIISTLHAKAVLYDGQVAANEHMKDTVRLKDKKLTAVNETLNKIQDLFRQLQNQLTQPSEYELYEQLGLPIEPNGNQPYIILPNGRKSPIAPNPAARPYELPSFDAMPVLLSSATLLNFGETDFTAALAGVIPRDKLESLVAYRDRRSRAEELDRVTSTGFDTITKFKALDGDSRQKLTERLAANFGILPAVLNEAGILPPDCHLGTTDRVHLAIRHQTDGATDGAAVNGSRLADSAETPFEQYLGWFQENPVVIGAPPYRLTIVVSNVIEACSLLSVPEVKRGARIVVSGTTRLERVAAKALAFPFPVSLVEYRSGRRCGRHRKLRDLLYAADTGKVIQINPGTLRLGIYGFETVARLAQQNAGLGAKLAVLAGLPGSSAGTRQPSSPQSSSAAPPTDGDIPF